MDQQKNSNFNAVDFVIEFRKNLTFVFLIVFSFVILSSLFVFVLDSPKFTYTKIINSKPLPMQDVLNFVTLFKEDISNDSLWQERSRGALVKVEIAKGSNLIRLNFQGSDPDYLKDVSVKYTESALKRIHDAARKEFEIRFNNEYLNIVRSQFNWLKNNLESGRNTDKNVLPSVRQWKEKYEVDLKHKAMAEPEIVEMPANEPRQLPRKKTLIPLSALLGIFVSIGYIACKCIWRKRNF